MTASFAQTEPARRGPSPVAAVTVGLVAGIAGLVLITAGMTFLGLAIGFPIALPVAEAYHIPVSAADAALARQFAGLWWAFLALAVASFAAAVAIVVKVATFLSPAPRD
jgi:hypothetical protein